jgi:hypothetical protein
MAKYVSDNRLLFFWLQLKTYFQAQEAGKGLSTNDFSNAMKTMLEDLDSNAAGYQNAQQVVSAIGSALTSYSTTTEVGLLIDEAIAAFDHDLFIVVTVLPDVGEANPNKIYIVPADNTDEGNSMAEWVVVDGAWEKFGTADLDLTDYWNTTNLTEMTEADVLAILAQ